MIDISWDLKYRDDGDLVFSLDKFQVCSIFNIFAHNKPCLGYMWPRQTKGLFLFSVNIRTIQQIFNLSGIFGQVRSVELKALAICGWGNN